MSNEGFIPAHPPEVLVVDDEPAILRAVSRLLASHARVTCVPTPAEAVRLLSERGFDIVLSDEDMPWMRGEALLRKIAASHPSTRRVLMSGQSPGWVEAGLADGALHAFVAKPFSSRELLVALGIVPLSKR